MLTKKMFGFLLRILPPEQKRRTGVDLGAPDIRWSLMQLRRFGFIPKHVMDVGALKGDWTRTCCFHIIRSQILKESKFVIK